jgi:23S rRNA pseudouridine2604 synthase
MDTMRLNKYISESGLCSRRAADKFIEQGQVFINGKRAKVGDQVNVGDAVSVNGQKIEPREGESSIIIAYNKPVGVTSTTEAGVKANIVDHVNYSDRVFPIGRLDKDSQGLIFLTNNGDLVNKILRAGNNHEKEYLVTVNKPIDTQFVENMAKGVPILGVMTKKCKVKQEGSNVFRITLIQGLNRQIRRMCEHFGYEVTKLERVRIMNIKLKGLAIGDWRELDEQEMAEISKLLAKSSSEVETPKKSAVKPQKDFSKFKPATGANIDRRNKPHAKSGAKQTQKGAKANHSKSKPGKPSTKGRRR